MDITTLLSYYNNCLLCHRQCGINRSEKTGYCGMPDGLFAARAALHYWEEPYFFPDVRCAVSTVRTMISRSDFPAKKSILLGLRKFFLICRKRVPQISTLSHRHIMFHPLSPHFLRLRMRGLPFPLSTIPGITKLWIL